MLLVLQRRAPGAQGGTSGLDCLRYRQGSREEVGLGKKWAEVDEITKAKYEAMADKDKARYAREMAAYKSGEASNVVEEEDDEEEEDGE